MRRVVIVGDSLQRALFVALAAHLGAAPRSYAAGGECALPRPLQNCSDPALECRFVADGCPEPAEPGARGGARGAAPAVTLTYVFQYRAWPLAARAVRGALAVGGGCERVRGAASWLDDLWPSADVVVVNHGAHLSLIHI